MEQDLAMLSPVQTQLKLTASSLGRGPPKYKTDRWGAPGNHEVIV